MSSDLPTSDICFNVVVVGDSGVGKSSIIKRFCTGQEPGQTAATVAFELHQDSTERDGQKLQVRFYDTAGDPKFQAVAKKYYSSPETQAFVLMYDITNYESFTHLERWLGDIAQELPEDRRLNTQFLVLGNKVDQRNKVAVQQKVGQEWAESHGFVFKEASAKSGQDVNAALNSIINAVYEIKYRPRVLVERISREDFGGESRNPKSFGGSGARDTTRNHTTQDDGDVEDLEAAELGEEKGCCLVA